MTLDETLMLVRYSAALDTRIYIRDDESLAITATAWHNQLPEALTASEAQQIAHELHRTGQPVSAGGIDRMYRLLRTPKHRQGIDTQQTPVPPPGRSISPDYTRPALSAPEAVLPQDVPEYVEAMSKAHPGHHAKTKALAVACPFCNAQRNEPCTRPAPREPGGRVQTTYPHPSRYEAPGLPDPVGLRLAGQKEAAS